MGTCTSRRDGLAVPRNAVVPQPEKNVLDFKRQKESSAACSATGALTGNESDAILERRQRRRRQADALHERREAHLAVQPKDGYVVQVRARVVLLVDRDFLHGEDVCTLLVHCVLDGHQVKRVIRLATRYVKLSESNLQLTRVAPLKSKEIFNNHFDRF